VARRLLGLHALLVYAFLYAPILVIVVLAFNGGRNVLYWEGFSTKWFGAALRNSDIRDSLQTSLIVASLNAVVACILGTLLALALSRMRAWVRVPIDTLAYMTLVTPEIVFGIAALIFFVEAGALVGVESPLGLWTILAAHVVFNASVVALIVRARFVGMGQSLEEASFDLGAGPLATFRQVTLPRLAPAILAGGLLAFTFSFDDFYTSFFVSGVDSETLPIYIFSQLRFGVSPEVNATAAMILGLTLAAIVVAYLILRRSGQEREGATVPGV
jgi:spermidine/putrescine transport system permease protein